MSPHYNYVKKTPYKMLLGQRLEILRNQLGLDAPTMASRLNITIGTYRTYKKGEHLPSVNIFSDLVKTANISLNWLFTGIGDMFYPDVERAVKEALEAERTSTATDSFQRELDEMKLTMQRVPMIKHMVMGYYQQVKMEQKEIIDRETQDVDNKAPNPPTTVNAAPLAPEPEIKETGPETPLPVKKVLPKNRKGKRKKR
ncbi:MAG: helix-turn-helix transcriptional regulator [bacterium]|nr:helix-turn-helix transcriptional regulator [bacterium]